MKVQQQDAWVLHTRPYRESSLLVELFTRNHGRVALVANGARGKKKTPAPRQFVRALASWVGRGPLFTLTECELGSGLGLQGDSLACGFYVNELLLRMTEPLDVHNYLFATYAATIGELTGKGSRSAALRRFEHALLQDCGYAPDFTRCGDTGAEVEPLRHYALQPERGFVEVQPSEHSATGAQLLAIYIGDFQTAAVRRIARAIFQAALRPHLGDRPLASRDLLLPRGRS